VRLVVGDCNGAVADYNAALRLDPQDALAYYHRGVAYHCQGDLQLAIADFTQAIQLNSRFALAYRARGNTYFNQGAFRQAIDNYTQAISIFPGDFESYTFRGLGYSTLGEADQAKADYDEAIRLNQDYAYAYFLRGMWYAAQNMEAKSIADLDRATDLGLDPDRRGDVQETFTRLSDTHFYQGEHYGLTNDFDRAIDEFNQAASSIHKMHGFIEIEQSLIFTRKITPAGWKMLNRHCVESGICRALFRSRLCTLFLGQPQQALADLDHAIALTRAMNSYNIGVGLPKPEGISQCGRGS
jgi:tetratricopeptide (TPR) repeat protein